MCNVFAYLKSGTFQAPNAVLSFSQQAVSIKHSGTGEAKLGEGLAHSLTCFLKIVVAKPDEQLLDSSLEFTVGTNRREAPR